jgi:ribosomal-protein-alanine N-acetyltransferase
MDNRSESPSGVKLPARPNWSIHYRPMSLPDVPQVHAIDQLSFSLPWPERSYHFELTQNENSILWVAEALFDPPDMAPRITGMIVVWLVVDEAHVATLAVHPDFRGQGLSKKLLALGLRSAILRGAIDSTLEVRASNLVAQKLYEQFNYHIVGQRPRYYRDNNEDALLMTVKGLGPAYLHWLDTILAGV